MSQMEHSAILSTFIKLSLPSRITERLLSGRKESNQTNKKLSFVFKIFILSIFEWPFCTGFAVDTLVYQIMKLTHMAYAYVIF